MAKYELIYTINPSGSFGLPEDGVVAVPEGVKHMMAPEVDLRTNNLVTYGSLSIFRNEPLRVKLTCRQTQIDLHDNRVRFVVDADTDEQAIAAANNFIADVCLNLTVVHGSLFHAEPFQAVRLKDEKQLPPFRFKTILRVRRYDIERLKRSLDRLPDLVDVGDDQLRKAADYFSHAIFLEDEVSGLLGQTPNLDDTPYSFHSRLAVSDVILNYFKACSSIVGDPKERDYQSRYKRLGIEKQTYQNVDRLYRIRSNFDIAHHSSKWDELEQARMEMEFAYDTAWSVLRQYAAYLTRQKN